MRRSATIVATIILSALCFSNHGAFADEHFFSVRDSIEMSRPYPQDTAIRFSPNGKYFATITSRGQIATDTVESTLWVFSVAAVQAFVRGGPTPRPIVAARIAQIPLYGENASYSPVMMNFRWAPDSENLYFQAQGKIGERRLYMTNIATREVRALTPPGYDAAAFAFVEGGIACIVSPFTTKAEYGQQINADAIDLSGVTGESFYYLLSPGYHDYGARGNLWIFRHGIRTVVRDASGAPLDVATFGVPEIAQIFMILTPSPDGKMLVVGGFRRNYPAEWSAYQLVPGGMMDIASHVEPESPAMRDLLAEYTFVDTVTGRVKYAIDAPMGLLVMGNYGGDGIAWAPNGDAAVLLSTFLPRNAGATENAMRAYPCQALVVQTSTWNQQCLRYTTAVDYQNTFHGVEDLGFADPAFSMDGHTLWLAYKKPAHYPPPLIQQQYSYSGGTWMQTAFTRRESGIVAQTPFNMEFRQDLNTPPALWVTGSASGAAIKLWDPNPQLAGMNLGKAIVYRWRDSTGYPLVGGLVLPPNYVRGKRYPLVLQTHGFDPQEGLFLSDGFSTTANAARPLASAGIVVLQMDWNVSHMFGPQEPGDDERAFESAIHSLAADGIVDPTKVGAIGFSYTGWQVESTLVRNPKLFVAASINEGSQMDYWEYLHDAGFVGLTSQPEHILGARPFGSGLAVWMQKSPGFNLDRVRAPILIGTGHGAAGVIQEWGLYATLSMLHKPVDFFLLRTGLHELQKPLERLASQQMNVDWFRFWLQGYEDPDPSKAAQYRRWEAMKAQIASGAR